MHRGHFPGEARRIAEDVEGHGRRCHFRVDDAGTADGAEAGAEELRTVAGPRSVRLFVHCIANASYGVFAGPEGRLAPKQFHKTFEGMANSFVYWTQALLDRDLLAPGARILALSNPMTDSVVHGWGLVAAAKASLEAYVRHLGHEVGPRGYSVAMLKFGLVETRAIRLAFEATEWERVKREVCSLTPARRLCTVEEVGAFVSLLAGIDARWLNGTVLDYSGSQAGCMLDGIFHARHYEADKAREG